MYYKIFCTQIHTCNTVTALFQVEDKLIYPKVLEIPWVLSKAYRNPTGTTSSIGRICESNNDVTPLCNDVEAWARSNAGVSQCWNRFSQGVYQEMLAGLPVGP